MTKSAEDIVDSAKKLPPAERAAVIEALLEYMDASDLSLDAKWAAEAESRLEAYVAGELDSVEADEVLAQIRK
jgi:putative addiction module component (TIGR02574 family)